MTTPIAIHPQNSRYFLFRDKPRALICATEHYGSVLNRRFDFERYLPEHAEKQQTLTRLFLLFRELQSTRNPYSPCKVESPDFVAPWPRSNTGTALDGEPLFDLNQWNAEYFERLHRFFQLASDLGIVIEATLLAYGYGESIWSLNPLHPQNNNQDIGVDAWAQCVTLRDAGFAEKQREYVQKVVTELNPYDNFYFEVCNEPGTGGDVSVEEVDAWQAAVAGWIREMEAGLPNKHLVFASQPFTWNPFTQTTDAVFADPTYDAVTVHPLPNTCLGGRSYDLGAFMSKQMRLSELKDFFLNAAKIAKPCVNDEDNAASCYRDFTGWTIDRKRAWVTMLCGGHYDVIDFSLNVGLETGTEDSRACLRSWMKHLSQFVHSTDFIAMRPVGDWLLDKPAETLECALAAEGKEYVVYLVDPREVTDARHGTSISGSVRFALPDGGYRVSLFSPTTGGESPSMRVLGGETTLALPTFAHDIALHIVRAA